MLNTKMKKIAPAPIGSGALKQQPSHEQRRLLRRSHENDSLKKAHVAVPQVRPHASSPTTSESAR